MLGLSPVLVQEVIKLKSVVIRVSGSLHPVLLFGSEFTKPWAPLVEAKYCQHSGQVSSLRESSSHSLRGALSHIDIAYYPI